MSVGTPAQHPVAKICIVCGIDVSQQKRIKDTKGRYYCQTCWKANVAEHRQRQAQPPPEDEFPGLTALAEVASSTPAVMSPSSPLLTCSVCHGAFSYANIRNVKGELVCSDCIAESSRALKTLKKAARQRPPIPEYLQEIAIWERRLLWVILLSVLLFPLALLLLPLHLFVMYRLARALGLSPFGWILGTLVPYLNILVLLMLNGQAVSILKAAGLRVRPFALRWERGI